jgi:hypothetical protein
MSVGFKKQDFKYFLWSIVSVNHLPNFIVIKTFLIFLQNKLNKSFLSFNKAPHRLD